MTLRMDYKKEYPEAFQAMLRFEKFVVESGINRTLLELIKLRTLRSMAALTVLTFMPRMLARKVSPNNAFIYWVLGGKRLITRKRRGLH